MEYFSKEAEIKKRVKQLQDRSYYYEIEDYAPKIPLMSHQKKAFELHRLLPGSGNYGEMGSGKTASAICAIHWNILTKITDRCLVVCPKSVIKGWEEQIEMFSDLTYVSLIGSSKDKIKKLQELDRDVFIINYESTWRIEEELLKKEFNMIICDEAHRIKNPASKQSKSCYKLGDHAERRIALTGTPVLNTSMDAFGVMRFVDSTIFGESYYSFRNRYFKNVSPDHSPIPIFIPRAGADNEISDRMYTRALRFLKDECMDLPEATLLPDRVVTLSEEQDRAYREMQEDLCTQIRGDKTIKITHVLALMMKLNQITSGWMKDSGTGEIIHFKRNPKFEELKEVIDEIGNQPTIIWAYYIADMNLIYSYFSRCTNSKCKIIVNNVKEENCPNCGTYIKFRASHVQGSTKYRQAEIAKFRYTTAERAKMRVKLQEEGLKVGEIREQLGDLLPDGSEPPQTNIIACQCVAASEGLNLQRSTYSVFYSRNYSLKDWTQALARNHRKGQTEKVTYINLVARMRNGDNTVDQKIADSLRRKENLSKKINKDDIRTVLGNFKKKDREAFKDVELEDDVVEGIPDPEAAGNINTSENKASQNTLF